MDKDSFRAVLGRFASGVTIITTLDAEGAPTGLTATSFASLSLDPPLVLFCLARTANCFEDFQRAGSFAVNILAHGQDAISNIFASRGAEKYVGVGYRKGELGDPLLDGALASMECRIAARHPGGDHVIYVGEVQAVQAGEGRPLLYYQGKYHTL
ncbi:MAG: flavin reductase family protein [Candidatus Lambdaproteobacteria bacterium]|nr:flavin reductase family protein [Candidatus Lambdaproteobacteria bacterium]